MPSCELLVFLLMVSVFSTTLSLSALAVLCNHTQNESSATVSALILTRSPAAPAPVVYHPAEPHLCCRHSLSLHPLPLSLFKMDRSTGEEQHMRLPFLSERTQKSSDDRVKGICNTQKHKDDKTINGSKNASVEEND